MGLIKLLDKETINKIAAGEVVERPSSVVKELIENAIDAGAGNITCEIKDGGKSFIRITDNGSGIAKDDIELAFLRHSTSKIRSEADLDNIRSLGFRGEALSSISAVSKVEMLTKRADDFLGNRFVIEGGAVRSFDEAGCPDGTTFIVRDIFYNTPARRKFLRTATTEAGYINDLMNRLAVSHPEIAFRFINQGKTVLFTNGNGNEKDALYSIYGRDVAANLIAVSYHSETISVSGYIGKPVSARGNRVCENYYINGRYSKSPLVTKAIEEAYKGYTMQHKYPFTSLHFTFPMEKLDINVHPAKMEVRISDGDFYFAKIYQIVNDALRSSNMIVETSVGPESGKTGRNDAEQAARIEALSGIPQSFETNRMESAKAEALREKENYSACQAEAEKPEGVGTVGNSGGADITEKPKGVSIPVYNRLPASFFVPDGTPQNDIAHKADEAVPAEKESPKADITLSGGSAEFEQLSFDIRDEFMQDMNAENFRIIGQLFATYWLIEMKESLFIIDQHAAHEKILYERTMKRYREQKVVSQQLYPPIIVTLSLSEEDILNRYADYFAKLGFEISHFGGREYAINAIPCDLFRFTGDAFFHDVLDQLMNSPMKGDIDIVMDRIATMSCKAAIKGNQTYSMPEAMSLIKELLKLDNPYHCPHGRPIIITMTKRDIEKKFKRIL